MAPPGGPEIKPKRSPHKIRVVKPQWESSRTPPSSPRPSSETRVPKRRVSRHLIPPTPLGLQHLKESCHLKFTKESFWKRIYSASSTTGPILTVRGSGTRSGGLQSFIFKDLHNQLVATVRLYRPWFKLPSMEVELWTMPIITVRPKGMGSRSLLVMDEQGERVLTVQALFTFWQGPTHQILDMLNRDIGSISRKGWWNVYLTFPSELDVRYKAALIAVVIYHNIMDD